MNLERLVKSFQKGKGSKRKHDWMLNKVYDWLESNTDVVGLFKEFELIKTNSEGVEYVVGEIDILAVYVDRLDVYSIKSGGFHRETLEYQFRKEVGFVLTEMVGTNVNYLVVHPKKLGKMIGEVKVW